MKPELFGLRTYFLCWLLATVCAILTGVRLAQRAGFPARRAVLAIGLSAVTIVVGAMLLFLLEHVLFPFDDSAPFPQDSLRALLWHGFRLPGGILLLAAGLPIV